MQKFFLLKKQMEDRSIFTLLELLIVISVIAILAALLLPVLNKARQTAQRISCINNVKTISMGIVYYSNTSKVMPALYNGIPSGYGTYWYQYVYEMITGKTTGSTLPVTKVSDFFRCPSYRWRGGLHQGTLPYGYNVAFKHESGYVKPEKIKRPSQAPAIGDSDDDGYWGLTLEPGSNAIIGNRHNMNAVMAFCDGHAETVNSRNWLLPGSVYGIMDYSTGGSTTKSTGGSYTTALKEKWNIRLPGNEDYLTK